MSLPADPDCYWVEPDRLLAGEYPGSKDESVARAKLGALLDCGMRTFVDLTEAHELVHYEELLQSEASARGVRVAYQRHPIVDVSIPSAFVMRRILAAITASVERKEPVYVHCYGGIGRTGTVVGCWMIEQGTGGEDPIATIVTLRRGIKKARTASPETSEQAAFVRDWPPPRRPSGKKPSNL